MIGHYRGAATDVRWARMARRLQCSPVLPAGVFFALIERRDDPVSTWDAQGFADYAGVTLDLIHEILDVLRDAGMIVADRIVTRRDYTAAERMRRYRARKKAREQGSVTADRNAEGGDPVTGRRNAKTARNVTRQRNGGEGSVTEKRNVLPETVTPSRNARAPESARVTSSASVTDMRNAVDQSVTAKRNENPQNVTDLGGDIGGGNAAFSSCSVDTLSHDERDNARALVDHMLDKLTSAGAVRSPQHAAMVRPRVAAWAGQGVTLDRLDAAIAAARAARIAAGSAQPLNVGYIEAKLANLDSRPAATPASVTAPVTPAVDAELLSFQSWANRRVEFGTWTAEEAAAAVQAERAKRALGVAP